MNIDRLFPAGRPSDWYVGEASTQAPRDVIAEFRRAGVSIAEWARTNGFQRTAVYGVINGRCKGAHGAAHEIAVALGLKAGAIVAVSDFKPKSAVTAKKAA